MLTLDAFVEYAKREIPVEELPIYILYAIRASSTMVVGSSELLCKVFAPYPEALRWAQSCYSTTMAWHEILGTIKSDCATQTHDPVATCKCILQNITPIIAQINPVLKDMPSIDLSDEADKKVFNILKSALERLSKTSFELEQQDLSWLKEFMDREAANRQQSRPT